MHSLSACKFPDVTATSGYFPLIHCPADVVNDCTRKNEYCRKNIRKECADIRPDIDKKVFDICPDIDPETLYSFQIGSENITEQ